MTRLTVTPEESLYARIAGILHEARGRVARTVNTEMVHAYWLIGREIVEGEQKGKDRAGYGEGLVRRVARRLAAEFGRGFSVAGLKRMKQFYLTFPRGSALPGEAPGKGSTVLSLSGKRRKSPAMSALLPQERGFPLAEKYRVVHFAALVLGLASAFAGVRRAERPVTITHVAVLFVLLTELAVLWAPRWAGNVFLHWAAAQVIYTIAFASLSLLQGIFLARLRLRRRRGASLPDPAALDTSDDTPRPRAP